MSEQPISPTLARLIREVRRESVTTGPNAYNRMYNRHMRSHAEVEHNRRQEAQDALEAKPASGVEDRE